MARVARADRRAATPARCPMNDEQKKLLIPTAEERQENLKAFQEWLKKFDAGESPIDLYDLAFDAGRDFGARKVEKLAVEFMKRAEAGR